MKYLRFICLTICFCLTFIPGNPGTSQASEESQCFECHTSAKQLIEITREIAKTRPAAKSTETEGEG